MRRLAWDESGIAMGLAVILIVIIGVMGAGLLVFVRNDLEAVVEVNQGQRAFEMADAGVQAAEQQLKSDSSSDSYDGSGAEESQWSSSSGNSNCSDLGEYGICLTDLYGTSTDNLVNVQIEYREDENDFRVVSTGRYGDAKRSVEAIFEASSGVQIPPVFFTRTNLTITGSSSVNTSTFALRDVRITGSSSLGNNEDEKFGKWAETSGSDPYPNDSGSFPNDFNRTPRGTDLVGIATQGELRMTNSAADEFLPGTKSFGGTYEQGADRNCADPCPRVVPDYDASLLPDSEKIAFPFDVPSPSEDEAMIDTLRKRALQLEQENPGERHYFDSNPGDGVRQSTGYEDGYKFDLGDWPSNSDWDTVVFFDLESPEEIEWDISKNDVSCDDTSRKGIIVVNNGEFRVSGTDSGFNGGIIVRGNPPTDPDEGTFRSSGNVCMNAYVNASGEIKMSGSADLGNVPPLSSLSSFESGVEQRNWRECYTADCD